MTVLGTLHIGMGVTHLNAVMLSLEVPCLTENGYKKVENYQKKVVREDTVKRNVFRVKQCYQAKAFWWTRVDRREERP